MLTIFNKNGQKRTEIEPNDNSTQTKEVQGENLLNLSFTHYEHIPMDVLDYVDFEGERYWLTEKYTPKQRNDQEWEYDLKLYGVDSLIKRFLVLDTTDGNAEPIFTLTATPREHAQMVLDCINAGMGNNTPWQLGQVDGENLVVIDYNGTYCNEALSEIVKAVGGKAEWWFDAQTLNICRCETGDEITLGYGNGLTEPERDTSNISKFYTRLFPIGSERNIDPEKYGYSRLMLPGKKQYVEIQTDEYGVFDHFEREAFSGIYPRRIGTVSAVRSENATDEDGNPFTIFYFKDESLDFDPNDYELPGETKRISFQDGDLAGMGETDDHYFEANYNSKTKEFELVTIWPYDSDMQLPGGNIIPRAGDHYILWNISMPDEYYTLAEQELKQAVDKYNSENWFDLSVYKGTTDHVWLAEEGKNLFLGRRVRLESPKYFPETGYRSSRITKITRKVTLPLQMDIEISDAVHTGTLEQIGGSISQIEEDVASGDKKTEQYRKEAQDFTVRRFRDTQETIRLLEKSMSANFTASVSPLSVRTMAALVGDESLQYRFIDAAGNPVVYNIAYNNTTKQLTATKGILQHLTLGIKTITSSRKKDDFKTWNMAAYTSPAIISETDINKAFYLYAKVSKTENTGTYVLSENAVAMEEVAGCYHLLVGILNSEYNKQRSFVTLYGFTEVLPGRITTDKIMSADGKTYFDLSAGEIGGKVSFRSTSGGYKDVGEAVDDVQQSANEAQSTADKVTDELNGYMANTNAKISGLQQEVDKTIISYSGNVEPKLDNYPANDWGTDEIKRTHINDLYDYIYKDNAGGEVKVLNKRYKFLEYPTGTFSWQLLSDTDSALAINLSGDAIELAKGKARTFYTHGDVLPNPPYSINDLWFNDPEGNDKFIIYRCITELNSGIAKKDHFSIVSDAELKLADIANDNKLTAQEKQSTQKEWDIIVSEKPKNVTEAGKFGVSVTAYNNAYNDLNTYITPLLANLGTTNDIVGSTFRSKFQAYYDARTDLLNAISSKAKALADAAQDTATSASQAATEAKQSADNAKNEAKAANDKLTEWANDGKISPTEKPALRDEIQRINADKDQIAKGYSKYALGTPTVYNTAYANYNEKLAELTKTEPESITIPSDFKTKQTAYYTARTNALTAISNAAKDAVDNIQIGGVNLYRNYDFSKGTALWKSYGNTTVEDGVCTLKITGGSSARNLLYNEFVEVFANKQYTVSADVRSDDIKKLDYSFLMYSEGGNKHYYVPDAITSKLNRIAFTFNPPRDGLASFGFGFGGNGTVQFKNMMFEEGNKATTPSPSPKDVAGGLEARNLLLDSRHNVFNYEIGFIYTRPISIDLNKLIGKKITLSFDYQYENFKYDAEYSWMNRIGTNLYLVYGDGDSRNGYIDLILLFNQNTPVDGSGHHTVTKTIPADVKEIKYKNSQDPEKDRIYIFAESGGQGATINKEFKAVVSNIMFEISDIEHDWRPAPEEYAYLEDALERTTEINGGLVLSNVIGVRDTSGAVVAGLSGLGEADDDAVLWTGANFANMQDGKALCQINKDGSGWLAGQDKIKWGNNGDLDVGIFSVNEKDVTIDFDGSKVIFTQDDIGGYVPKLNFTLTTIEDKTYDLKNVDTNNVRYLPTASIEGKTINVRTDDIWPVYNGFPLNSYYIVGTINVGVNSIKTTSMCLGPNMVVKILYKDKDGKYTLSALHHIELGKCGEVGAGNNMFFSFTFTSGYITGKFRIYIEFIYSQLNVANAAYPIVGIEGFKFYPVNRYTVIGRDGFIVNLNDNNYFSIERDQGKLNIIAKGLVDASNTTEYNKLPSGALYTRTSGGYKTICIK